MFIQQRLSLWVLYTLILLTAVQAIAQSSPEKSIPVHSLSTGSNFPDIIKLNNIVVDDSRCRAYFTGALGLSQYIGVIDTDSLQITGTINTGVIGFVAKHLSVNPGTGILYMLAMPPGQDKKLYRIDPVTGTVSSPLASGRAPAIDTSTNKIYLSASTNTINIYDDMLQPAGSITGVTSPGELFIDSAQRRLYVVNPTGVSVYNIDTKGSITKYNMPSGFTGIPRGIYVSYGKIYVSDGNATNHSLSIIDEVSESGTCISIAENGQIMETYNGKLYEMTGYPYYAGYLPNADGSYGVLLR